MAPAERHQTTAGEPPGYSPHDDRLTELRHALIASLQRRGVIGDARVAEAFEAAPRHLFLPGVAPERVYSDQAIATKEQRGAWISSSSQPAMMAIMLQQLALEPGLRVLEIGAGTGYNAALMRYLVGPTGTVVTIDVDDDIVADARTRLAAAGYGDVQVVQGDGGYGYPAGAPYDRIVLTVGAADLLPAWVEQLRPDGLLLLPLWLGAGQYAIAFRRLANGVLVSESMSGCSFIRLRGAFAGTEREVTIGEWSITFDEHPHLDPARALAILERPLGQRALPDGGETAALYLACRGEPLASVRHAPTVGSGGDATWFLGLLDTTALSACLLTNWPEPDAEQSTPVGVLYGSPAAYERLERYLADWQARNRPRLDDVRLLAYPHGLAAPVGVLTLRKPWSTLVLAGRDGQPLTER